MYTKKKNEAALEKQQQMTRYKLMKYALKVPIRTAADDKSCTIFPSFQQK